MALQQMTQETPIARAKRLWQTGRLSGLSQKSQYSIHRICSKLPKPMFDILDQEGSALRVCRWVAWGKWLPDRTLRLALTLYLRHEVDLRRPGQSSTGWSWAKDRPATAAERVFRKSQVCERLVAAGVLAPRNKTPTAEEQVAYLGSWDLRWAALQRELATMDRDAFLREVTTATAPKGKRKRRRKRPLTQKELLFVDSLSMMRRAVIDGSVTLEDLADSEVKEKKKK